MNVSGSELPLDEVDKKILHTLISHGRITWTELAAVVKLSGPAAAERVRRMEERGIIRGYTVLLDSRSVGLDIVAFVGVTLERTKFRQKFIELINGMSEVQECYHVSGEDDFLLKIRCENTLALEQIIVERLKKISGILRAKITIVLSPIKEIQNYPIQNGIHLHSKNNLREEKR